MTTLIKLYELASEKEIMIANLHLPETKSLSMMDDGKCFIGIDPKEITSLAHQKEMLGHEIGHCVKGAFYNVYSNCDIKSRHEYRANKWRYLKLLPHKEIEYAVNELHLKTVCELAQHFNLSCEFVVKALDFYKNVKPIEY